MITFTQKEILEIALRLLVERGMLSRGALLGGEEIELQTIASDGSTRRFWRLQCKGQPICVLCAPNSPSEAELREAGSAFHIGRHLHEKGCAVPETYGYDERSGLLLFEDLGADRLHGLVSVREDEPSIRGLYREVVKSLAYMQVQGCKSFDSDWCWDGHIYDRGVMLERESGYFLRAFWTGMLGESEPGGIVDEFGHLADKACSAPAHYFLHRDFQSRNIMMVDGTPSFIDFQGGRLGPLGYDIASLMIDPYTGLSCRLQEDIVEMYIEAVGKLLFIDREEFLKQYRYLSLQRNLQIIGAYAFLSQVRKKSFFVQFLRPALKTASQLLEDRLFIDFPLLKNMVAQALRRV